MEEVRRWMVTYTKHVKQKRKVYQDGFLELRPLNHKIILYDEYKNVLDSRFVKKDDVIQSGEAIAFDSYLVDIDHLEGDRKLIPTGKDKKIDEKPSAFSNRKYRNGFSSPVNLGEKKTTSNSLSPSQKIIREFMKKEMIKYSSPSLPDASKSTDEWLVLYTTQVTQKFKKYHDGFIQLVHCGSQGGQIMLYDGTRRLLNSRFLKKHEVIRSGESLSFDGHLVDIGECAVESKPLPEKDCYIFGKTGMLENQSHPLVQSSVGVASQRKYDYSVNRIAPAQTLASAPIRSASEIMSFIKRPATTIKEGSATTKSLSSKGSHVEASHSVHSKDKILKDDVVQDLKCQPDAMHCPSACILKVTSLSESPGTSDLEAQGPIEGYSEDNIRSDAAVTSTPRSRENCFDRSNLRTTSPVMELEDISFPKVDSASKESSEEEHTGQLPVAPSEDVNVKNIEDCADQREIKAICDEASGEGMLVQISCTSQSPFVIKDVPSEQEMAFWKMDDAPSFDLGF